MISLPIFLLSIIMESLARDQKLELQYEEDQSYNQVLMSSYRSSQFNLHQAPNLKPRRNRIKNTNNGGLKKIIKDQKIRRLVDNFCKKLLKNNTNRQPADCDLLNSGQKEENSIGFINTISKTLSNTNGIRLSNASLTIWSFINIVQITVMVFILSIIMTFPQTSQQIVFLAFRIISGCIYIIDMILNFITIKQQFGKSYFTLDQIFLYYINHGFITDILSIMMLIIDIVTPINLAILNVLLVIVKLLNNLQKFQKYEYLYIRTKQRAMYFRLVKVFLTNFAIAHILSIALNQMTLFNQDQNWHQRLNIASQQWYIKYIWGYYWGTNIMLTVGFGDIAAANIYEAATLIFIETVSCITLAYNISTVGALISQLKASSDVKSTKIKVFHTMCKQNQISPQLETKVNHFIEQSFQIKQAFQFDQYDKVLESLPKNMQSQYRKEANKILFDNLGFLNNFSKKTLICLAQTVNRKIAHPQQIIKKRGQFHDFCVLQKGKIDFVCRFGKSILNGLVIQSLTVSKKQKPKALSLGFIQRKVLNHDIQSDRYSILYYLNRQDFIKGIYDCDMDYQLFCTLKDKDAYYQDQNQLYLCNLCSRKSYHNKFDCSKLHYIPLKQKRIANYLAQIKKVKQNRSYTSRQDTKIQALKQYKQVNQDYVKFIQNYYGRNFLNSIWAIKQLHGQIEQMKQQDTFNSELEKNFSLYESNNNFTKLQRLIMESRNNFNQFWQLQTDQIKNYRYYFSEYNAQNYIKEKYSKGAAGNNLKFMTLF